MLYGPHRQWASAPGTHTSANTGGAGAASAVSSGGGVGHVFAGHGHSDGYSTPPYGGRSPNGGSPGPDYSSSHNPSGRFASQLCL